MKKSIFILLLLFSSIRCFAKDKIKFSYNGSWSSVYICDWYIKNGNFKFDNWKNKFKYLKTDFLIINYSETEKKGFFISMESLLGKFEKFIKKKIKFILNVSGLVHI